MFEQRQPGGLPRAYRCPCGQKLYLHDARGNWLEKDTMTNLWVVGVEGQTPAEIRMMEFCPNAGILEKEAWNQLKKE